MGNITSLRLVGAVTGEIDFKIQKAQHSQTDPGNRPPDRTSVPGAARAQVLCWAHSAHFTCRPGVTCHSSREATGGRQWTLTA